MLQTKAIIDLLKCATGWQVDVSCICQQNL